MKDILYIYLYVKRKLENAPRLRKLKYHGWMHTKSAYDAVCYLATLEDIDDEDAEILKAAALYHDTGQMFVSELHEYKSIDIARIDLKSFGYPWYKIDSACGIIESTLPNKRPIGILQEIMCDADFEYLGRDYYNYVSELLRAEIGTTPPIWRVEQIAFMKRHRYLTRSAQRLFNHQKEINLKRLIGNEIKIMK